LAKRGGSKMKCRNKREKGRNRVVENQGEKRTKERKEGDIVVEKENEWIKRQIRK
jgi:hypothetical protein